MIFSNHCVFSVDFEPTPLSRNRKPRQRRGLTKAFSVLRNKCERSARKKKPDEARRSLAELLIQGVVGSSPQGEPKRRGTQLRPSSFWLPLLALNIQCYSARGLPRTGEHISVRKYAARSETKFREVVVRFSPTELLVFQGEAYYYKP